MTWLEKKIEILKNNNKNIFSFVELNILNYCNRNCDFCPLEVPKIKSEISIDLYIKLLNELKELNYKGLIGYSGFSEPTLHSKLELLISTTKEYLPESKLVINSNGDLLNKEKILDLFKLGLDYLVISLYDNEEQFNKFNDMNLDNVFLNKRYNGDMIKNNRAGSLYKNSRINEPCYYPFYMLYVDWNGDILFCSHNYNKENILGNLNQEKLINIWNNNIIKKIKNNLLNNKRTHIPCNKCDVIGTIMGEEYFEYYKTTNKTLERT